MEKIRGEEQRGMGKPDKRGSNQRRSEHNQQLFSHVYTTVKEGGTPS
jgi:hypothetical protein